MKLREPRSDCEHDRLTQRVARLEEKLFRVLERNAQLEEENARLQAEVERLGKENTRLQQENTRLEQQLAAARKDSSTSSKPPSSDIVKLKKPLPKGRKKRKKGGQPGHEQHVRPPFPPEAVDHFEPHTLDCCPDCGGRLVLSRREPEVLQQVEITQTPTVVTEYQGLAYWCPHCRKGAVHGVLALSCPARTPQRQGNTWGRATPGIVNKEDWLVNPPSINF